MAKHFVKPKKLGILIANLGSPTLPKPSSVRIFLREFLSDPRVVELPRIFWLPILNALILPIRSRKSAKKYQQIWLNNNQSPLHYYTNSIADKLNLAIKKIGRKTAIPNFSDVIVLPAYRYGQESLKPQIDKLITAGCRRILLLPLYPQYSATTTASMVDKTYVLLKNIRHQPTVQILPPYFDHPDYIQLLADSVRQVVKKSETVFDQLIFSNHGIPELSVKRGDPYACQARKTARLVRENLAEDWRNWQGQKKIMIQWEHAMPVAFQSRFGPAAWVKPYTADLVTLAKSSAVRHLAIIAPSFAVDCLETLEEINILLRNNFLENHPASNKAKFSYIPCLNDQPAVIDFYLKMLRPYIYT